jgi:pumilio RNA-binding family
MAKEAREDGDDDLCTLYLDSIDPIVEEIIQSVELLAQHSYGCRAVQRMVEYCIEPQRSKVLDSIIACQHRILCHMYGNYVIQKILQHGRPSDRDAVFKLITSNNSVIVFSKQKQASNVVEAMLRLGDANQRQQIVHDMLNVSCFFVLV